MAGEKFNQESDQENTAISSLPRNANEMVNSISNEESLQLDFTNHAADDENSDSDDENSDSDDENSDRSVSIGSDEKRAEFTYRINLSAESGDSFQEDNVLPNNLNNSSFDKYSKILFPVSFIVFNICYAVVCILAQK